MNGDMVLDASVAASWLFPVSSAASATSLFRPDALRIAPDLIFAEFISVASRVVRGGLVSSASAREAVARLALLIDEVAPAADLALPAFDLASRYSFSAYDSVYLALALRCGAPLVTADAKLARRAMDVGLAGHVRLLTPESRP